MKNFVQFLAIIFVLISCSSNDSFPFSDNKIVGEWNRVSHKVNGVETSTNCTEQTLFTFEDNGVLRQTFFTETSGNCSQGTELISNWTYFGDDTYAISNLSGNSSSLKFVFSNNNSTFTVEEENNAGDNTISVFQKKI